jgi:hypothetical protein
MLKHAPNIWIARQELEPENMVCRLEEFLPCHLIWAKARAMLPIMLLMTCSAYLSNISTQNAVHQIDVTFTGSLLTCLIRWVLYRTHSTLIFLKKLRRKRNWSRFQILFMYFIHGDTCLMLHISSVIQARMWLYYDGHSIWFLNRYEVRNFRVTFIQRVSYVHPGFRGLAVQ